MNLTSSASNAGNFSRFHRRRALQDAQVAEAFNSRGRRATRRSLSTAGRSKALDAVNEKLDVRGLTLHPTKGYRRTSRRRTAISFITSGILGGARKDFSTAAIAAAIGRVSTTP